MKNSYKQCIALIKEASKDYLDEDAAEKLLEEIDELAASQDSNTLASLDEKMQDLMYSTARALKESALLEKRNALINAQVEKRIMGHVSNFTDPGEALKAYLAGGLKDIPGIRDSVDARGRALTTKYLGQMIHDLEADGLLEHFASGKMDLDIARELWELPHGQIGITKNLEAQKIAAVINKFQNDLIDRQNKAGAFIRLAPGYIVKQTHNTVALRKAGYDAWRSAILPLLDVDKTFKGADIDEFLKEAYGGLSTGMHIKAKADQSGAGDVDLSGFKGPANLAKKLSKERVLHFKSAEHWHSYNQQFGSRELREAVFLGFEMGARNISLMEGLGTNPEIMMAKIQEKLRHQFADDPKKLKSLNSSMINNIMAELTGKTKIPGNNITAARIGHGWRMINNLSKLGGAVISSITDIPFQAALLRYQGHGLLESYANSFQNLIRGRGSKEQKEIARLIGVGVDGIISDIASRFSTEDTLPGTMAKVQQRFFKLNLMSWWTDSHKTGVGLMISNDLAENASLSFDKLRPDLQKNLRQYNITEKEWDIIRETAYAAESGNKYITPDKIAEIDINRVKSALDLPQGMSDSAVIRALEVKRNDIETSLQSFLVDSADIAVPHPGAYEKALFNQGTQVGTVLGEATRYIAQFKSFPVTVIRKGLGRTLYGSGADNLTEALFKGKGDMLGLAHLMVMSTLFGYVAMAAKDTLKGREPRDPNSPDTWKAAMLQGGGLGIYGDFILGEYSRHGNSFLATALGPTASTMEELFRLKTALQKGEDSAAKVMKLIINNTPFVNLFYTRAALDYLFIYQLQESINPGYLRRLEQSIMRENNQEFYVPPSDVIPYGGGDQMLEGVR
ncbi:MAG TPA: hypothetical protein VD999_07885 [Vitreimonas sp.]|nr:hypothetical protein [Vitreimonas sp.]